MSKSRLAPPTPSNNNDTHVDNGQAQPASPPKDLFDDLDSLRLSQDYTAMAGVQKVMLTVPVRKPAGEWFVRVHPAMQLKTLVLELKEDREIYMVEPALVPRLAGESTFGPRLLVAAMNRQAVPFIWPLRLPRSDNRVDDWTRSALDAAAMARTFWVRVSSNMDLKAYDVFKAAADWPEPDWPELPFGELLRIAFRDKVIDSLEHPVLKRLRGEA
jgi:hypothetical protein